MRKIYILITLGIVVVVALIAFAFVFFEKEKHRILFYEVKTAGDLTGYIKIDYYKTEDKIIYKSTYSRPKELDCNLIYEKIIFDRASQKMEKYTRKCKTAGLTTEFLYIKGNDGKTFDFLCQSQSKFSVISNVPADNASVFNANFLVTYIPFVRKYDFAIGRSQSFNAIYCAQGLLPPAREKIILTSVKDEYIEVGGKKTKTEVVMIRGRAIPRVYIWVSKKEKDIVQLEIKSKSVLVKKTESMKKVAAIDNMPKDKAYRSRDIIFPSGDIALAGTLDIPRRNGKLPSVLLVTGEGQANRENNGLYTYLSDYLAKNGYIVLRFDRRGTGKSQGDSKATSIEDEILDIENALKFLVNLDNADKNKVFVIAHQDACSYISQLEFSQVPVRGAIMMGVTKPSVILDFECRYVRDKIRFLTKIDKKYPDIVEASQKETLGLVESAKKDYIFIGGMRIFLKRMRQLAEFNFLDGFQKLEMPILIIQGKKDKFYSADYLKSIEDALNKNTLQKSSVVYFRNLGHFLGEIISEKDMRKRYKIDEEVLETIKKWLDNKCKEPPPEARTEPRENHVNLGG